MKKIIKIIIIVGVLIAIFGAGTVKAVLNKGIDSIDPENVKKWTNSGIDAIDNGVGKIKENVLGGN